nr:MAG TPA: hypothetical protein [Caudoviricetes sp.]
MYCGLVKRYHWWLITIGSRSSRGSALYVKHVFYFK